jgi:hypothetical protein
MIAVGIGRFFYNEVNSMRRFILLFLLAMLAFSGLSCIQTKISDSEKKMLFTFADLADYTDNEFEEIEKCEAFSKVDMLFYLKQYSYTFNSNLSRRNHKILYLNSILQQLPSEFVAKRNMPTQAGSTKMAYNISLRTFAKGMHLKDDNRLFTLGDQNYHSYIITKDNRKVGNIIITRVGKYILQVIMMGLYFDERETLEDCMRWTVERLQKK